METEEMSAPSAQQLFDLISRILRSQDVEVTISNKGERVVFEYDFVSVIYEVGKPSLFSTKVFQGSLKSLPLLVQMFDNVRDLMTDLDQLQGV